MPRPPSHHAPPTWMLRCTICRRYTTGRGQFPHNVVTPFVCGQCKNTQPEGPL